MTESVQQIIYKFDLKYLALLSLFAVIVFFLYHTGLDNLFFVWTNEDNYSHGILIPAVSAYLVWQVRHHLYNLKENPNWVSIPITVFTLCVLFIGELTGSHLLINYSLYILLFAVILAIFGWKGFKILLIPYMLLFFAIPLPQFFETMLSADLQLISSTIGVKLLQLINVPVFQEGNIIDLGDYKLQVVEACSGLRYLFPLISFGFIAAYLYKVELWKRIIIFLSTIPITVLMNSFRIAVVGILVNNFGIEMAEGFVHDFEGWILFMICLLILFIEMYLLTKVGTNRQPLNKVFMPAIEQPSYEQAKIEIRDITKPFIVILVLSILSLGVNYFLNKTEEITPVRKPLVDFPISIGHWKGRQDVLNPSTLKTLQLSDYVIADYQLANKYETDNAGHSINFYVSYYESQKNGIAPHSPKVCIPGGGWEISAIESSKLDNYINNKPLHYNRVIIQKGETRQLVYYWFQQQGETYASEYMLKLAMFRRSLLYNRTDGALVRLVTSISPAEKEIDAEQRLNEFARQMSPVLTDYVPD